MLNLYAAVMVGGALGSLARYVMIGNAIRFLGIAFPWGTLGVNVLGSLLMGAAAGFFASRVQPLTGMQALISVGFLGGFTTFSAFSLDVVNLLQREQIALCAAYIAASAGLSVAALLLGLTLMRRLLT
ncbi:MAG: fluoride efflux transporter CrcB [Pseudomonadota bacterium]|jgi:fluoride exporter|nr:fluoride efflux transporter CrcB [Alphaproteobacteria bacterium]